MTSDPRRDVEKLAGLHPGWRITFDAGVWYARGPWLQANTLQATSAEDLDARLDGRACTLCGAEHTPMTPTGVVGGAQLFQCTPTCPTSPAVTRDEQAADEGDQR